MKRNVLIFGLILGTILAANGLYMVSVICANPEFESNDTLGYAAMIVVLSLIFFGVRNYRNKELGGIISLGTAFKTGAFIALLGASIYVGAWLPYYYLVAPNFIDQYTVHMLHMATLHGATSTELAAKTTEMAEFKEMYKSPLFVILISYAEVLPIGLVVAFISALILKKKAIDAPSA